MQSRFRRTRPSTNSNLGSETQKKLKNSTYVNIFPSHKSQTGLSYPVDGGEAGWADFPEGSLTNLLYVGNFLPKSNSQKIKFVFSDGQNPQTYYTLYLSSESKSRYHESEVAQFLTQLIDLGIADEYGFPESTDRVTIEYGIEEIQKKDGSIFKKTVLKVRKA